MIRRGPGLYIVVLLSLLSAGCSTGPTGRELAKQACTKADPSATSVDRSQDAAAYAASRSAYQEAAVIAAKAARKDSRWDALATAESGEADVFTQGTDPVSRQRAGAPWSSDQQTLQALSSQAQGFEFTIRAECLKARA